MLESYRVLLAPLRFGAGLKGKIVDSWNFGTPVVTTSIGSEGLFLDKKANTNDWGGTSDANLLEAFVEASSEIYCNESIWFKAHRCGIEIFSSLFDRYTKLDQYGPKLCVFKVVVFYHGREVTGHDLIGQIQELERKIFERRSERDIFAAILWDQKYRTTEYFSKWIELKEKGGQGSVAAPPNI